MRQRIIPCRGCPTVGCTCFTGLESELLDTIGELLKALGFETLMQFREAQYEKEQHPEKDS